MSMAPTMLPGETLFVEPCPSPARGDIVAFSVDGSLLVHRIVRLDAETVTCRGDNRLANDPTVPRAALLGKVVQIAGRDRVPDARRDVARVWARLTLLRALRRPRRIAGELWLFSAQIGLGAGPLPLPAVSTIWDRDDPETTNDYVLKPSDIVMGGTLANDVRPGVAVVVPAGVFSRLSRGDRADLFQALAGRTVTVWALTLASFGRLVRLTAALRRSLQRIGLEVGEPGDMYAPPGLDGRGGHLHATTAAELAETLRAAGGDHVAVEQRSVGASQLLRGRTTLRGTRSPDSVSGS